MDLNELRKYFDVDACVLVLTSIPGWTQEDVVRWANAFSADIRNPWFGFDGYIHELTTTIVPDQLQRKLTSSELIELRENIVGAILPVLRGRVPRPRRPCR